ncbi:hypothetical protein [Spirosoma sp. KUDC1026]|uniref:hypothetical protein n=1 Tax=Spirosoma sp. KUDC1026 TaxID=2745947 RepID=UPI00159BB239|nr:hypothetical protein [Spirosoma sp. KUDC1026]QKZ12093.1 hypothetical protein HU175_05400 [Spirosoma sp. KUDC1026]
MKKLLVFAGLSVVLNSCARTEHYYRTETAYDLHTRRSDQSPIRTTIRQGDTLVSNSRLRNPNGRFVRVRHGNHDGYVQFWGQRYLSSAKSGKLQPARSTTIATTK